MLEENFLLHPIATIGWCAILFCIDILCCCLLCRRCVLCRLLCGVWVCEDFGYFCEVFEAFSFGLPLSPLRFLSNACMRYVDGSSVGQSTGDYEGMILKNSFSGYNLYLIGYEGPDPGIYFEFDGTILSPKGTLLP